jgi:hypothetical protein
MRFLLRCVFFVLPTALLALDAFHAAPDNQLWLYLGAACSAFVAFLLLVALRRIPSVRCTFTVTPIFALPWLLFFPPGPGYEGQRGIIEGVLMAMPFLGLGIYWLERSGALTYRRARLIAHKLSRMTGWPSDLTVVKDMPIVRRFQDAIQFDAGPALTLLEHTHPAVRVAALAALEFRQHWRTGQPNEVLKVLETDRVPEVRLAAVRALGAVRDRRPTEVLAQSLGDQDLRVREAVGEILFSRGERRIRDRQWQWMRTGVRSAMSSNYLCEDGPLLKEGQLLSPEAINDFVGWVADRGPLGVRAAETVAVHYSRLMREEPDQTIRELITLVESPTTSALLRVQLAKLLSNQFQGDIKLMEKLLSGGNPVPLRQMAAEVLLTRTGRHPDALTTLREIARLGNRELALDTARIVQHCLNVDLGMAIGQPMPHPSSPRAADITRKLLQWAMQSEPSQNAIDLGASASRLSIG